MHRTVSITMLVILSAAAIFTAHAQEISVSPPIINLYNKQVSNDEIFYIGGAATVPGAIVIIYTQKEDGAITSHQVTIDELGQWFYSQPEFLSRGDYTVWTQLKVTDDLVSPPSSKIEFKVSATAIQVGQTRINFETLYAILTFIFVIISLLLAAFIFHHFRQHKKKSGIFAKEMAHAESAILRDFTELKKDIKARLSGFTGSQREKSELLHDLKAVENHLKKELGNY